MKKVEETAGMAKQLSVVGRIIEWDSTFTSMWTGSLVEELLPCKTWCNNWWKVWQLLTQNVILTWNVSLITTDSHNWNEITFPMQSLSTLQLYLLHEKQSAKSINTFMQAVQWYDMTSKWMTYYFTSYSWKLRKSLEALQRWPNITTGILKTIPRLQQIWSLHQYSTVDYLKAISGTLHTTTP